MNHDRTNNRKRNGWATVAVWIFVLPVLYVLSIGPVFFLLAYLKYHALFAAHDAVSQAAEVFYWPLGYAVTKSVVASNFLLWYRDVWQAWYS
jgi:hypothetical protein